MQAPDPVRASRDDGTCAALTIQQPYASLVASGAKRFETRAWRVPTVWIGTRFAIHAGLSSRYRRIAAASPAAADIELALAIESRDWDILPIGAVVAIATLAGCRRIERIDKRRGMIFDDGTNAALDSFGDYAPGRFVWSFSDVKRIRVPIPARGARGIWHWKATA